MKIAKGFAWLGVIAMTVALVNGFVAGSFFEDGKELMNNPWGIVSLVDLYVGFILFSLWIVHREKTLAKKILWVVLMMVLGFFTGALYVLIALYKSDDDWYVLYHGKA
jgi:drug/metabolite transporter (DMT)-like permease